MTTKNGSGIILCLIGLIYAITAYAATTDTEVSRLKLDHPDLGHDGGSLLHGKVRTAWTKIGDEMNSRYKEFTAQADSTTVNVDHNLGAAFAEYRVLLYTGTGASKVRVSDPTGAGWTIAAGTPPTGIVDVTTPGSGGPHDFSVIVIHNPGDLPYFETMTPATTKGDLIVFNGTDTVRFPVCPDGQLIEGDSATGTGLDCATALVDPMTTRGDVIIRNASNTTDRLAIGAAGAVLQTDGTDPSYALIDNANVDAAAAIVGTKIDPDFGAQNVETTGTGAFAATTISGQLTVDTTGDVKIDLLDDGGGADNYRILTDPTNGYRIRNETNSQTFFTHQIDGDLFLGNVDEELRLSGLVVHGVSSETIASGAITVGTSIVTVTGEGAAADDLVTINGCIDGAQLTLRRGTGTITVTEGGNIQLASSTDFVMGSVFDRIVLACDGTNWSEISRSDNG